MRFRNLWNFTRYLYQLMSVFVACIGCEVCLVPICVVNNKVWVYILHPSVHAEFLLAIIRRLHW